MSEAAQRMMVVGVALLLPSVLVASWSASASRRLKEGGAAASTVAVASMSDDSYCTPQLKAVVRRVAGACGLLQSGGGRGCQPMEAQKVASLSDGDFNSLFRPLAKRAHILQFDPEKTDLDTQARALAEKAWGDQRGASFFFVVARASPDGEEAYNELLSRDRAKAVLSHLSEHFKDPDLEKQVGLLWLGEQFAQMGDEFCTWSRSRNGECSVAEINRSAFVAWIDCAI